MANGVLTYTCTLSQNAGPEDILDLITADLPVSDYTIIKTTLTIPVWLERVAGGFTGNVLINATIGKTTGISFSPEVDFSGAEISVTGSDAGKIKTVKIYAGSLSYNINRINAMQLALDDEGQGSYISLGVKAGSTIKLEIEHTGKSACFPPSSVTAPATIHYHGALRVQWNAGTAGNKSPITGYAVYRSSTANGTYTKIATLGADARYYDDYDYAIGDTKYYKIKTITDNHSYDSALSSCTNGTTALQRTTAPTIRTGASGGVYNPRPRILLTLGTDALEEALTVTAQGYQGRPQPMAASKMAMRRMEEMEPGQESVTVTNTDTSGVSYSATATVKVLSIAWTDDPIVAGETRVKAAHIMELRTCLDNICDYYGLSHTDWGGDITAGVTSAGNWPAHMAAIQATARRIAQFINSWDAVTQEFGVTLPFFESISRANANAVNQMRQIITIL